MNINRDYLIINDVKKSNVKLDNGSIFFYITDKNTQNIFVNLVINVSNNDLIQKYANIENAEDYTLTMNIVKPDNTYKIVEGKLHDKEKAIFEFDLKEDCCDEVGTYKCELLTKCNINDHEEITTSNKLTYKVKSSVLNDLDEIQEAPEYPLVIQLFDKLSDIEQYEEDRRANELARQLAEQQRQTRFDALDSDMTDSIQAMDDKVIDVENRVSIKEQAVDKLIVDTKADIDEYKVAKDQEINNAITAQDNKIDTAITSQNDRITVVENNVVAQNSKLDVLETKATTHEARITATEAKNTEQDGRLDIAENRLANIGNDITNTMQPIIDEHTSRLDAIEAIDVAQNNRLDAIEAKNQQQDDRLLDIEKVNNRQDIDIKCLYGASQTIDVTKEGNSIYLQNSNNGFAVVDEICGNTLVNCNKEPNKEIILNGNINTSGYSNLTLTSGIDGGKVDIALEGNTMVNVCDQKDPIAITKSYTVETGNHVALQGEYDGKCRPVVNGNTLVNVANGSWNNGGSAKRSQTLIEGGCKVTADEDGSLVIMKKSMLKDNTTYTIIADINSTLTGINFSFYNGSSYTQGMSDEDLSDYSNGFSRVMKIITTTTTNCSSIVIGSHGTNPAGSYIAIKNLIVLEGDYSNKPIPDYFEGLQSSFEDKVVTQEMVDNGEELAENLGKYKVDYVISREDGTVGQTKTFYLNSPLLEGDTIEQQGDNVVHVHRSEFMNLYDSTNPSTIWNSDGAVNGINWFWSNTLKSGNLGSYVVNNNDTAHETFSDKIAYIKQANAINIGFPEGILTSNDDAGVKAWIQENNPNVVYKLKTPQYEVISQNDTILCDSYVNGHLDVDSVVPIKKVAFERTPVSNLRYLYPSTEYIIQFEADNNGYLKELYMNSIQMLNAQVTKGINKFTGTTGTNNWTTLDMDGIGFNASNIVVTEATDKDFGYFEGMKSVGECEDLEVVSSNKNLIDKDKNSYLDGYTINNGIVEEELSYACINRYIPIFGDTITYTGFLDDNGNEQIYGFGISFYDINKNYMTFIWGDNTPTLIPKGAKYIKYFIYLPQLPINMLISQCQLECSSTATGYIPHAHNTQTLTHEPLRAVGDIKDKYVLIDGKWYIERNCSEVVLDGSEGWEDTYSNTSTGLSGYQLIASYLPDCKIFNQSYTTCLANNNMTITLIDKNTYGGSNLGLCVQRYEKHPLIRLGLPTSSFSTLAIFKNYLQSNNLKVVYQLATPTYEPIDYNPFTVYSDITHISNNSTIPCNMTIKNTGFNCLLKPSTTYTVSSNLGLNTVTTPSVLTEDCLRFYDTDTSSKTIMKDVMVLEGDYTTNSKPLPSHFSGIESAFEQEYDEAVGKYKVKIRVQNEDASKENYIEFYIQEPLRGIRNVKDKVYVKNDKVVVQRNCGSKVLDGSDDEKILGAGASDAFNIKYSIELDNLKYMDINSETRIACNKFNYDIFNLWANIDKECVSNNNKVVVFRVSKLKAPNSQGFKQWLQNNPVTVVYQLAEPTYEEVEYNDVKLFIESFKNSTLFYNSNVPVTSKLWYSYSVPIVDTVAQTANVTDQQDQLIIDLSVQVAVLEMMTL